MCILDAADNVVGAGVLLGTEHVLTCAHVVTTADRDLTVQLLEAGGNRIRARVDSGVNHLSTDQPGDVALLRLDRPHRAGATLRDVAVGLGRGVWTYGFPVEVPDGEWTRAETGGRGGPGQELIQLNTRPGFPRIRAGYSGAGVIDGETRDVIGIVVNEYDEAGSPLSWMMPVETILEYLPQTEEWATGEPRQGPEFLGPVETGGDWDRVARALATCLASDVPGAVNTVVGNQPALGQVVSQSSRERRSPAGEAPAGALPGAGSIDLVVDVSGKSAAQVARRILDRVGVPVRGPGEAAAVERLHGGIPSITIVLDGVDDADDPAALLNDVVKPLADQDSQLVLGFRRAASRSLTVANSLGRATAGRTTRCNRPDCPGKPGQVDDTDFCRDCLRRPLPLDEADRGVRAPRRRAEDSWLPTFDYPDPSSRVLPNPEVPERDRFCRRCANEVGRSRAGQPALTEGYCTWCRHPFLFRPTLYEGDLVADQYEVIGCLAYGGFGWVYLAHDTHLDTLVVLKGVIDKGDAKLAEAERDELTRMDHPNIVRIMDFVTHPPDPGADDRRDYIVMEYVPGPTLRELAIRSSAEGAPLGEALRAEHVIECGLQILAAYEHLHARNKLYCDMKPDNVIVRPGQPGEDTTRVKLLDMGAVRRADDRTSLIIGTYGYLVGEAEIRKRGLTVQSDLYALGITLRELIDAVPEWPDRLAVGRDALTRGLGRAIRKHPDRRFATAAEMAEQLRGVQREVASLRDGRPRARISTVFAPAATLLDAGLGTVPPLKRWVGGPLVAGGRKKRGKGPQPAVPPADDGRPGPALVATALPAPRIDPDDPAAALLEAATEPDPQRLLDKLRDRPGSAELHFARCRAYLGLGRLDDAQDSATQAGEELGVKVTYDWRVHWHDGLVKLAREEVDAAEAEFETVHDALPGEVVPTLALGFCAEHRGRAPDAERFYEAIWRRDPAQASAAFGLARLRLADGDPEGAVEVLSLVPMESRHYDNAAVAAVVILSGRWSSGLPTYENLREAADRLTRLYLDDGNEEGEARHRITALVREAALTWICEHGGRLPSAPGVDDGPILGTPDEDNLRELLEKSYRALAWQARNADTYAVLKDRANAIRPRKLW